MKKFQIEKDYASEENIRHKLENLFGNCEETSPDEYVVNDPKDPILNCLRLEVYETYICLDMVEKDLNTIIDNDNLDKVKGVLRKKNELLEDVTGLSVKDRKEKMRREVTDISRVEDNSVLEKY